MSKKTDRDESIVSSDHLKEDEVEAALRPKTFADFTGQKKIVENLKVFITAAKK